ncbi:hypothetical protein L6452_29042 [Arctium lappa]|uniref:Uncharacterized protein n=1 Tax=Arctium lappa TaxID=4217 RepID=A0ACB8ZFP2_ARCLA|nr:hypothetical protein L6452_29042 [Arctium lappa]
MVSFASLFRKVVARLRLSRRGRKPQIHPDDIKKGQKVMDVIRRDKRIPDPKRNHRTGNINHLVYDKPKVLDMAAEKLAKRSQPRLIGVPCDEPTVINLAEDQMAKRPQQRRIFDNPFDSVTVVDEQQLAKEQQEQVKKRAKEMAERREMVALTGRATFNANEFETVYVAYAQQLHKERQEQLKKRAKGMAERKEMARF